MSFKDALSVPKLKSNKTCRYEKKVEKYSHFSPVVSNNGMFFTKLKTWIKKYLPQKTDHS